MFTVFLAAVVLLAAAAPLFGVDTRRPEMLRTSGAGIVR
jgi:hypothetical protein